MAYEICQSRNNRLLTFDVAVNCLGKKKIPSMGRFGEDSSGQEKDREITRDGQDDKNICNIIFLKTEFYDTFTKF